MIRKSFIVSLVVTIFMGLSISNTPAATDLGLNRDFKTEMIYFAMIDRFSNGNSKNDLGGYKDVRTSSGYDPYDTAFYHGGDIQGLSDKLEYIKSLGFKTFSPFIDESYDECIDDDKRLQLISHEIGKFAQKSKEEKDEFLNNVKDICKHNQQLFLDFSVNHKKMQSGIVSFLLKNTNNLI